MLMILKVSLILVSLSTTIYIRINLEVSEKAVGTKTAMKRVLVLESI